MFNALKPAQLSTIKDVIPQDRLNHEAKSKIKKFEK